MSLRPLNPTLALSHSRFNARRADRGGGERAGQPAPGRFDHPRRFDQRRSDAPHTRTDEDLNPKCEAGRAGGVGTRAGGGRQNRVRAGGGRPRGHWSHSSLRPLEPFNCPPRAHTHLAPYDQAGGNGEGCGRGAGAGAEWCRWQAALALRAAVPGDCAAIAAIPAQQDGAAEVKPAPARLRVAIYPVGGTPLDSTHAEPRRAKTRERAAFAFA